MVNIKYDCNEKNSLFIIKSKKEKELLQKMEHNNNRAMVLLDGFITGVNRTDELAFYEEIKKYTDCSIEYKSEETGINRGFRDATSMDGLSSASKRLKIFTEHF